MSCLGAFADYSDWEIFWSVRVPDSEQTDINRYLEMAASDIHAALAATGACDCDLAAWAEQFLIKLNVIDAAALFESPCGPHLTADKKQMYIDWISGQLEAIRTGKLELCAGETGSETPVLDWATPRLNEFAAAQIVANDMEKNS